MSDPSAVRLPPVRGHAAGREARDERWILLAPGDLVATAAGPRLATVLGSGVAVCLRDPTAGMAGMNHFRLAGTYDEVAPPVELEGVYAGPATRALVQRMLARGAKLERLEAGVYGGGRIAGPSGDPLADGNVRAAERVLGALGIPVANRDVGGTRGRRVEFDTVTGAVRVAALGGPGPADG